VFRREARSTHAWREGLVAYCRQQYGFGYGRLDLVSRHPWRVTGDSVSPLSMMLHPAAATVALMCLAAAAGVAAFGGPWRVPAIIGGVLLAGLVVERAVTGGRAFLRFRDPAALLFPALHLARDLAWVAAVAVWVARRVRGLGPHPRQSMQPRDAAL
jgi:hypothetical protein